MNRQANSLAAATIVLLLGAATIATPVSAASANVALKGHVLDVGGSGIEALTVEVTSSLDDREFKKQAVTSHTGRYQLTVRANAVYSISFRDLDTSDDGIDDHRFIEKVGHISVGSRDYLVDKKLEKMPSPNTVVVQGSVHNIAGTPLRIVVELRGTAENGTSIRKTVKTTPAGWYGLTVPANETYAMTFTDVGKGGILYKTASGHIRVGAKDIRLNKRLHKAADLR